MSADMLAKLDKVLALAERPGSEGERAAAEAALLAAPLRLKNFRPLAVNPFPAAARRSRSFLRPTPVAAPKEPRA